MAGQCGWTDCGAPVYRKHIHPQTLYEQDVCLTHWAFLRHTDVLDTHTRQLGEQKELLSSLVTGIQTLVEGQQTMGEHIRDLAAGQQDLIEGQNRQSRLLEHHSRQLDHHSQQLERHENLLSQLANRQRGVNGDSTA